MSKRRKCYAFESSGHGYEPLDGIMVEGGTFVNRLYCPFCGRVIPAAEEYNSHNRSVIRVTLDSAENKISDVWTNSSTIVRKSDA